MPSNKKSRHTSKYEDLPSLIERYTDKQFLDLVNEFESKKNINAKVALIHSRSIQLEGLLRPVVRTIDKRIICFGFKINDRFAAEKILNTAINTLVYDWLDGKKSNVEARLKLCTSSREKIDLLQEEITSIQKKTLNDDKFYANGYAAQKRKNNYFDYLNASHAVNPPELTEGMILLMTHGASDRMLEVYCDRLIQMIKERKQLPFEYTIFPGSGGRGGSDSLHYNGVRNTAMVESKKQNSIEEPKILSDVWLTGPDHYDKVIKFLQGGNISGEIFINDNMKWTKTPFLFVAAFVKKCVQEGYIEQYSASNMISIVNRTFLLNISRQTQKMFQKGFEFTDDKYTYPFKSLPIP